MHPKHLAVALFAMLTASAQATVVMLDNLETPAGTQTVSFGSALLACSMGNSAANAAHQHFTLDFKPTTSGPFQVVFANNGGDNIGAILDNVRISAVPEPQSLALFTLGLLALVGTRRRR